MPLPRVVPEIHVNDYGTLFLFAVRDGNNKRIDISEWVAFEVLLLSPDGAEFSRVGLPFPAVNPLKPDGFDGIFYYVNQREDFYISGAWFVQAFVDSGRGAWTSSTVTFTVFPTIGSGLLP